MRPQTLRITRQVRRLDFEASLRATGWWRPVLTMVSGERIIPYPLDIPFVNRYWALPEAK